MSSESSDEEFLRSLCRARPSDCVDVGGEAGDGEFLRTLCRADRRHPVIQALDDAPASCGTMPSLEPASGSSARKTPSASSPQRPNTESWKAKVARINDAKRADIGVPTLQGVPSKDLGIKVNLVDPPAAETPSDDDDDSSCQSPRAFDDLIEEERRSVRLHAAISFEEVLPQDREICAARLRHAVDGCALFYIGTTIMVLRRWTGGMMRRGYMEGHVMKWQRMRVIGVRGEGDAAKKLEEFLIDVGKSEYGSKCANDSRKAIGQCRSRPNFLYVCMDLLKDRSHGA